jgi:hypothetical protein
MRFDELLARVLDLLQQEGRVSYWALKRRFDLSDEDIEGLKNEIIKTKRLAIDEQANWYGLGREHNSETQQQTQLPKNILQ